VRREEGLVFAAVIASMDRQRVVPEDDDHGDAHGIELDVAMAAHQVVAVFGRAGLPPRARPSGGIGR
jgi:hypothetical protein